MKIHWYAAQKTKPKAHGYPKASATSSSPQKTQSSRQSSPRNLAIVLQNTRPLEWQPKDSINVIRHGPKSSARDLETGGSQRPIRLNWGKLSGGQKLLVFSMTLIFSSGSGVSAEAPV
jgi:hypothetical protein